VVALVAYLVGLLVVQERLLEIAVFQVRVAVVHLQALVVALVAQEVAEHLQALVAVYLQVLVAQVAVVHRV
jgi:hypothetical protein